jgi:Mg2+/Co2+ transporter CorB
MSMIVIYWLLLVLLLVISGFFSSSETGMMSVNRYRVRNRAQKGDRRAQRVEKLLQRPDRLLGVILLGNTFANIFASSIATILINHYFPNFAAGVLLGAVLLTFLVLILAETAPKTLAALYPQKLSFYYSGTLSFLLKFFYPMVWVVNLLANGLLRLFGVKAFSQGSDALSVDELKTIVNEASGKIRKNYQTMLLRILELEKISVEHVMVPKTSVFFIDLSNNFADVKTQLLQCEHMYVPLCRGDMGSVERILKVRLALVELAADRLHGTDDLLKLAKKPDFVPCEAEVSQQLVFFQESNQRLSCVVDEYHNIVGIVTLKDMVDEVVADFTVNVKEFSSLVRKSSDGGFLVSGQMNLLELDRLIGSHLSTSNAVTLSGLLVEYLEMIPERNLSVCIHGQRMEVVKFSESMITLVKILPK